MNEIAAAYLGTGARVWIIDVGRSYEKACRNFGGSFIEFTEDAALSLNPFPLVEDIDEDMELLQPLLAQMVSPRESLDGFQYSTLGAAIKKVWKAKGRAMTVTDIHDLLATGRLDDDGASSAAEGDRRLKDLAAMLHPYTRDGAYGKYFDSEASIDFGADLIVLELEELKAKKDLQTVVLLIVMYRITREMYFSRDRKKIVIIDGPGTCSPAAPPPSSSRPAAARANTRAPSCRPPRAWTTTTTTRRPRRHWTTPTGCSCCARSPSRSR